MAKLVSFNGLKVGCSYHEEWIGGTGTMPMTVVERIDSLHLKVSYPATKFVAGSEEIIKPNREFRFWDTEPTLMERELVAWKRIC